MHAANEFSNLDNAQFIEVETTHLFDLKYAAALCGIEIVWDMTPDDIEILDRSKKTPAIFRDSNIVLWLRTGKR